MFDFGWGEILVVAIVLIIVVGPKDLPRMLRSFGRTMTKLRSMAGEFRSQFDDALKEAELDDVRKTLDDARRLNPTRNLRDAMNPFRQAGQDLKADLDRTMQDKPAKAADPADKPVMTPIRSDAAGQAVAGATGPNGPAAQRATDAASEKPAAPATVKRAATTRSGTTAAPGSPVNGATAPAEAKTAGATKPRAAAARSRAAGAADKAPPVKKPVTAKRKVAKPSGDKKAGDA